MDFQWSDSPAPEIEYDISEELALLVFNLPVGDKTVDIKLAPLKTDDRQFFEAIDSNLELTTREQCRKMVDRLCSEWNGKPYVGFSGDNATLDALTSVLMLCRPKAYQPVKATLAEVPEGIKPRPWQWTDEPAPQVYYQLNADYTLSIWNVPDGNQFVEVKLRPLTEKDRTWFNQITTGKGTLDEQSAKLIAGLCIAWGKDKSVSEEALLLNPDGIGAIDRVMAVCFPRSFRPVKRRSRQISGDGLQVEQG